MQLTTFCKQVFEPDFFKNNHCLYFVGSAYPLLFISNFLSHIAQLSHMQIHRIDVSTSDEHEIQRQLQTTFLGQKSLYWFGNLSALDDKTAKKWIRLINSYQGPHLLVFFIDQSHAAFVTQKGVDIVLPDTISYQMYKTLFSLFNSDERPEKTLLLRSLFSNNSAISLDNSCLLMSYNLIIGRNVSHFIDDWVDRIVTPEKSLFSLSTYFFAKKPQDFFALWQQVQQDYSVQFWLSFWSEQLFRAHGFVYFMQKNNRLEAKKIAYRLPFSFIQRDWRNHSVDELKALHNAVYTCDYDIKNGARQDCLDLLYYKYFAHDFKNKKC